MEIISEFLTPDLKKIGQKIRKNSWVKLLFSDDEINWEKFRQEMLKSGVDDEEIRSYFQRYDTDGNMTLDQQELTRMQNSLIKLKQESNEANKVHFASIRVFFNY